MSKIVKKKKKQQLKFYLPRSLCNDCENPNYKKT